MLQALARLLSRALGGEIQVETVCEVTDSCTCSLQILQPIEK